MKFNLDNVSSQKGKIAIVTGANSGIGKYVTIGLTRKGVKVIMACRNMKKAEQAYQDIKEEVADADLEIMELDLSKLSSVRSFAQSYQKKYNQLNYLVENAGIMVPPLTKTEDGFESQMGINYFSHFLLTNLLMSVLQKSGNARVATTSSLAHQNGRIDFDNLNAEKKYSKFGAYSQSKLACLMFAYELQRRLDAAKSDVIAVSAHPGVSKTNLFTEFSTFMRILMTPLVPLFTHAPEKAALPMLFALLGEDIQGGDYLGPTGFNEMRGKPGKVNSKPHSKDKQVAKKLWEVSEKLTEEPFEVK